jgi:quercetin dioxygenase-like cupin family protein
VYFSAYGAADLPVLTNVRSQHRATLVGAGLLAVLSLPIATLAHQEPRRETVTIAEAQPIPNVPGKRLVPAVVEYPPGGQSIPHHHAGSAFIYAYVLEGEIRSQVDDEPARIYRAGESWFEKPGAYHRVSENVSDTHRARLLAVFILNMGDDQLTIPDHR